MWEERPGSYPLPYRGRQLPVIGTAPGRGCTRSPRWCDVHHLVSWADDGETEITHLCLRCRYHHTLTHLEIYLDEEARLLAGTGKRSCT